MSLQRVRLLAIVSVLLCVAVGAFPAIAQTSAPAPVCPSGYSLQNTFSGGFNANQSATHNFSLTQTSNVTLDIASGVGHPEVASCQAGGGNDPNEFPCDQNQQFEAFSVVVNGNTVYTTTDNAEDQWLDFGTQSAGQLSSGSQTLVLRHVIQNGSNTTPESVFYNVGVCVQPIQPPQQSNQGCTPGYWKNHTGAWAGSGFSASQTVGSVFSAGGFPNLATQTLLQALQGGGGPGTTGGAQILLRAAVAALLNAAHSDVNYPRTTSQIIADVNAALASNNRETMLSLASALDTQNNLGCPLN